MERNGGRLNGASERRKGKADRTKREEEERDGGRVRRDTIVPCCEETSNLRSGITVRIVHRGGRMLRHSVLGAGGWRKVAVRPCGMQLRPHSGKWRCSVRHAAPATQRKDDLPPCGTQLRPHSGKSLCGRAACSSGRLALARVPQHVLEASENHA